MSWKNLPYSQKEPSLKPSLQVLKRLPYQLYRVLSRQVSGVSFSWIIFLELPVERSVLSGISVFEMRNHAFICHGKSGESWKLGELNFICILMTQMVGRESVAMEETQVWSLGLEDSLGKERGEGNSFLEKEMATHSRNLASSIPWTEGPWWAAVHGVAKSRTQPTSRFSQSCSAQPVMSMISNCNHS